MLAKELEAEHRVRLFSALLKLNGKQDVWDQTLQLLNQGRQAARKAQLQELVDEFEKGQESVLEQLKQLGHFLPGELAVIEVGLVTGNINGAFTRLREHYLLQQQFQRELKRQLKWPIVIIIGALTAVLVWGFADLDVGILGVAIRLLLSVGSITILGAIIYYFCQGYRAGLLPKWLSWFARKVPGADNLILSGQIYHYLKNLKQCTDSGMALLPSLDVAARKIPDTSFTPMLMDVHSEVSNGRKLSAALAQCGILNGLVIEPPKADGATAVDAQQLICDAALNNYIEHLWSCARWLPQLLYVMLPLVALTNLMIG